MEWDRIQAAVEPPDIDQERIRSCNESCPLFEPCPWHEDTGWCRDKYGADGFVSRQEDGEGDCVW